MRPGKYHQKYYIIGQHNECHIRTPASFTYFRLFISYRDFLVMSFPLECEKMNITGVIGGLQVNVPETPFDIDLPDELLTYRQIVVSVENETVMTIKIPEEIDSPVYIAIKTPDSETFDILSDEDGVPMRFDGGSEIPLNIPLNEIVFLVKENASLSSVAEALSSKLVIEACSKLTFSVNL